jgi:hypothetical protein
MANVKISELPIGIPTTTSIFPFVNGGTTYQGAISAITSNSSEVTYSELVNKITGGTLSPGTFYTITNFRTCYDVPEYYYNGNQKDNSVIDYMQGNVDPIIVLATSANTISSTAYQPSYPNDRIQYDWTFNTTEKTSGVAYGRIFERIDEFNNRTDYDHRNIYFNRFQSYNKGIQLTGTIGSYNSSTGVISGNSTLFLSEVSIGNILFFEYQGYMVGVKVYSAISNTLIYVIVDPSFGSQIDFTGGLIPFYNSTSTEYYNEYKEVYIGQKNEEDFERVLTFNLNGTALHNYVGDYSKFYLEDNLSNSGFLLANNVFYDNSGIYSNTIGDRSYNNTARYWFLRNTIAGRFYNNVIHHNGFYSNNIGEYFNENIIKNQMWSNTINESFNSNIIYSQFYDNVIGNYFNENVIYSQFYENQIGLYFESNTISDYGNVNNFYFYRNRIGNNFNNNNIRQTFQNNQIGNQFNNNIVNGEFFKNVIGNGFNNNYNISNYFYGNHIGNGFNNNPLIGDNFQDNQIGEYFNNNSISYNFNRNQIGNQFENNTLGDTQYFNWDNTNIENLTGRTYNTFRNALNNQIGNYILGTELIMHDTVNNEYHKVKFTQWTQNANGGGFSYERTKVYPTSEPTVYFTKTNYGNQVDVIVEGSLEITRGNNNGIYNAAVQGGWNNNAPQGTLWNSIYTQSNNGSNFEYNTIGNEFKGNYILQDFSLNDVKNYVASNQFSGYTNGNSIGDYTFDNDFLGYVVGNTWKGDFYQNTVGNNFQGNSFYAEIYTNIIGENFYNNDIQSYFTYNTIGNGFQTNQIGNYFSNNTVGEYFYNNSIPDNFVYNTIDNYFQWNIVNTAVSGVCLSTGMLYDITTVNVFKNKNGDNRLSYYDESDVLTVETLTEAPCVGGLNALDIPENDLNYGLVINPSFTITSSDFTFGGDIYQDTTPLGVDGVDGFENTASQGNLYQGYYGTGLSGTSLSGLTTAYNALGLDLNNSVGRLWYVTWGYGSSINQGIVKFGSYVNGNLFDIQPIDTTDPNYLSPNNSDGTSLVGTFLFPATFTIYYPITDKSGWC